MIDMHRSYTLAFLLFAAGLATSVWVSGCAEDGGTADGDGACVPGMSEACTCDGGQMGAQVCEPDGTGFGECSCNGGETGEGNGDGDGDPTGDGDGDPTTGDGDGDGDGCNPVWDGESLPSWSCHIVPFFYQSCGAGVNGCHSREAFAANMGEGCRGWLSLEDVALGSEIYAPPEMAGTPTGCPDIPLHDRLLTLAPWQCDASSRYVDTVDNSYILMKMKGEGLCPIGNGPSDPMPPPDSGIMITQMNIDMIEAWIEAGAPID
jgi:hypothetical protein